MKLSRDNIKDEKKRARWESLGFKLPSYDVEAVCKDTRINPEWLHFGAGNIFRAFPARAQQELINRGFSNTGIIVCEGFDEEIIDMSFTPFDNLTISATLNADDIAKEIIASVTECVKASTGMERLAEIFKSLSLKMVSFTITEKGYAVTDAEVNTLPYVKRDMDKEPKDAKSLMGITAALCLIRFNEGKLPITLVSMDNCAENGDKLKAAVMAIAEAWLANGYVTREFTEYLNDSSKVAFPCSMIDKITPRPSEIVMDHITALGCEGMEILKTQKNTYVAPFVNAEPTQYLIIENTFPGGRPPLEKAGIIFTDRETVDRVEKMKVGSCLNPLHSILAVFGCVLGYEYIHEAMKDTALVNLIKTCGYKESLPYVEDPGIIKPADFIKEVIETRLKNPYIPDTPQRIAMDTSQKIPVRFGETLKRIQESGGNAKELTAFPFFFAGWLRYLLGVDDKGDPFEISPDPMLDTLRKIMCGISLGTKKPLADTLRPILSNNVIFGVSLYENGLAAKTEKYFDEMLGGPGAVANALNKYFNN